MSKAQNYAVGVWLGALALAASGCGAPEGNYQPEYQPPLQADPRGGVQGAHRAAPTVRAPKSVKVEAKTNDLTVELPAP